MIIVLKIAGDFIRQLIWIKDSGSFGKEKKLFI